MEDILLPLTTTLLAEGVGVDVLLHHQWVWLPPLGGGAHQNATTVQLKFAIIVFNLMNMADYVSISLGQKTPSPGTT